jgi:hypothetical protein
MYLAGIYGPPDPPMREAYGMWRNTSRKWGLYSLCFWAFDQFCLNSRSVPLEVTAQSDATLVCYHRPRAARSPEAPIAVAYAPEPSSRMNTGRFNARRANNG